MFALSGGAARCFQMGRRGEQTNPLTRTVCEIRGWDGNPAVPALYFLERHASCLDSICHPFVTIFLKNFRKPPCIEYDRTKGADTERIGGI